MTVEYNNTIIHGCVAAVENETDLLDFLTAVLEADGLQVAVFSAPGYFLEEFKRQWKAGQSPALVLTDLMMPNMDGKEMVRQMDQITGSERAIPVCVITACDKFGRKDFQRGEILYKPFELDEFTRMVHRVGRF